MSELIAMRQRIKAVTTIKKITHAMRLTAMSSHARLKSRKASAHNYLEATTKITDSLTSAADINQHPVLWPTAQPNQSTSKHLVIIVGAQKGLCANLNNNITYLAEQHITNVMEIITVGKRTLENAHQPNSLNIIKRHNNLTLPNIEQIATEIVDYIWSAKTPYAKVTVYYTQPKSFFVQAPLEQQLIPYAPTATTSKTNQSEPLYWHQNAQEIFDIVARNLLLSTLRSILLQSLIAEQAARFIAMDGATRNAASILDTMKLNYNKLRQAKITRELTDLAASF